MSNSYWIMECIKVFLAYLFLMYVYPSIIFRTYLRGKSRTFWFGFCVCAQIMLISTVVLFLCLLHIGNVWLLRILFYGSLIWSVKNAIHLPMTPRYLSYKMKNGTYSAKLLRLRIREGTGKFFKWVFHWIWDIMKRDWIEMFFLFLLVVYGILYYSWGPLQLHGYGFSDMPVHHSWIYGLKEGIAFSKGIYPEGMHCFAYAMSALFGIEQYSVLLFLQCGNIITFFLSAVILARELMHWRGTALVFLGLFLTWKLDSNNGITSMSRLQTALPQEFCLFTVLLIPAFLIRYLRRGGLIVFRGKRSKFYWDENLLVFCLAIAVSLSVHFYATLMAVFSCLAVVIVWLKKVFHWRRLIPLATAALMALLLACSPMALALAEGTPLQGSLYWALGVIIPKVEKEDDGAIVLPDPSTPVGAGAAQGAGQTMQTPGNIGTESGPDESAPAMRDTFAETFNKIFVKGKERMQRNLRGMRDKGYRALYDQDMTDVLVCLTLAYLGICLAWRILSFFLRILFKWKWAKAEIFDGYAMVALMGAFFIMMYSAHYTDFPSLIEVYRICAANHVFMMMLLVIPVDIVGALLSLLLGGYFMQLISGAAVAAVVSFVVLSGNFHGYLYLLTTSFNAANNVTYSILSSIPENQFTIVSPTEELYHIIDRGFHEEILTFVDECQEEEYYIPTKYIFFYVEKRPLRYVKTHFPLGPRWLGDSRYLSIFKAAKVGNEYECGECSDELAEQTVNTGSKLSNAYSVFENRQILESKMLKYVNELLPDYPNEISKYYEDEYFVCYCVEQNPARLINLGIGKA